MSLTEISNQPANTSARIDTLPMVGMGLVDATHSAQRPIGRQTAKAVVLDNTMRVTTPENISFEYRLAGPFRRFLAYLIDILITVTGFGAACLIVFLLMTFVIGPIAQWLGLGSLLDLMSGAIVGSLLILYFLVYWFYGAFFETCYNGQTLGKRASGLRVLSVNGHAIDGVQATLRNFFRLLDVWPAVSLAVLMDFRDVDAEIAQAAHAVTFPTFLVGLTVMSLSRKFQRVGDLVADTVVVMDGVASRPNLVAFTDPRVASLAELIPQQFVASSQLAKTIASFVDLRRSVPPQRANEIAAHLAAPLMEKFGIARDTNYDLFICALYYKTFVDARNDDSEPSPTDRVPLTSSRVNFLTSATLASLHAVTHSTDSEDTTTGSGHPLDRGGVANEGR